MLSIISANSNKISDISPIAGLENSTGISFSGNEIKEVSEPINSLKIGKIDFSNNQLSDLDGLSNLTILKHINLSNCDLSSANVKINFIEKNLQTLEYCDLSNNNIKDISSLENNPKSNVATLGKSKLKYSRLLLQENSIKDLSCLTDVQISKLCVEYADDIILPEAFNYVHKIYISNTPLDKRVALESKLGAKVYFGILDLDDNFTEN